jgi:hypothetical protein
LPQFNIFKSRLLQAEQAAICTPETANFEDLGLQVRRFESYYWRESLFLNYLTQVLKGLYLAGRVLAGRVLIASVY